MYANAPPESAAAYNKRATAGAITWFVYRVRAYSLSLRLPLMLELDPLHHGPWLD
jgi:hypothetical protein